MSSFTKTDGGPELTLGTQALKRIGPADDGRRQRCIFPQPQGSDPFPIAGQLGRLDIQSICNPPNLLPSTSRFRWQNPLVVGGRAGRIGASALFGGFAENKIAYGMACD
jgi:hypothetical protein